MLLSPFLRSRICQSAVLRRRRASAEAGSTDQETPEPKLGLTGEDTGVWQHGSLSWKSPKPRERFVIDTAV